MTVAEAITKSGITPSASYTGIETADDFVFAIQTKSTKSKETDWVVCADHVKEHSGALNSSTTSDTFIRTGPTDTKSAVQRTLSVNGNRCVGDAFQDFLLSRKIVFGTVHLLQPAHRQGRKGQLLADRHQRRGRCSRFPGHLCLRRQEHWRSGRVCLYRRWLIFPASFPAPPGTGIFYAVKQFSPGQHRGTAQRKEPYNGYLWTGL